jgi:uncharacterized protein (DUF2126 family)
VGGASALGVTELVHFATLVAAAEREACAKVCEANVYEGYVPPEDGAAASYWDNSAIECAAAIRARAAVTETEIEIAKTAFAMVKSIGHQHRSY